MQCDTATGLTAKKRLVRAFFWFVATRRSRNRSGNDDFGRNKGLTAHNYNKKSPSRYPELASVLFSPHFYARAATPALTRAAASASCYSSRTLEKQRRPHPCAHRCIHCSKYCSRA